MVLVAFGLGRAAPAQENNARPTFLFAGGNVYTLDARGARAEAIFVAGDRITAVGTLAALQELRQPDTRTIPLNGATVLPGLIDAHGHMAALGSFALGRLDLSSAKSFDEFVAVIAEQVKAAKPGAWIVGGRWDHESWPDRALPTHAKLSAVSPDNPVWLTRVDGHAGLANAAAMKLAGVTRDTGVPRGGDILKDGAGEPTGIFLDNAEDLIAEHAQGPSASPADLILAAQKLCLAAGLTGVHDAGITPAEADVYKELADAGQLKLRVYALLAGNYAIDYFTERAPLIGERFTLRSCKLYADGALGSRGAWLIDAYSDKPTDAQGRPYTGFPVMQTEFLRRVAEDGLRRGYQVCTHAIGDRGNREALSAYAVALSRRPTEGHRFRVEHAQVLTSDDLARFKQLGVIASMQPTHCTSDLRWAEARLGPRRCAGAYAWARLLRSGAALALGSDFPVESHNPFLGLYAAVTRQDREGAPAGGWRPQERMTREEALRGFTLGSAYAAFEEDRKGTLEPGKLADFVVIDRDVLTCDPLEIPHTRVLMTVIGGEIVHRAQP
jgi:hypothetical protein